jgi:hypothetical protein
MAHTAVTFEPKAVTFPVRAPDGDKDQRAAWYRDLKLRLRDHWNRSTALANWAVHTLFRADQTYVRGDQWPDRVAFLKAGERPKKPTGGVVYLPYLFGFLNEACPAATAYPDRPAWRGAKGQANIILRGVQSYYKRVRGKILRDGDASWAHFRWPYPFPLDADQWHPEVAAGDRPRVRLSLPGGELTLALKDGKEMRRQMQRFRQLLAGAKKGEAQLLRDRKGRVQLKLVGWFPVEPAPPAGENQLLLRTAPDRMLIAERLIGTNKYRAWVTYRRDLREKIARHARIRKEMADDNKRPVRGCRKTRLRRKANLEDKCDRVNDAIKHAIGQVVNQVVDYCVRQKVGLVIYADLCRSFFKTFPWATLRDRLSAALAAAGIGFNEERSQQPTEEGKECPSEKQLAATTETVRLSRRATRTRTRKRSAG